MSDEDLVEKLLMSSVEYDGHFIQVNRDLVKLPDGREASREYMLHPGAAMIIPILPDGQLVVERQFRYPLDRVLIEFPAGKKDPGESGFACAQRELAEETGYRALEWAYAGVMHNAPAYSSECIEIWFARGLTLGICERDEGEFLEVLSLPVDELEAFARDGSLTDAKTLIGLLWVRRWLSGDWPISWIQTEDSAEFRSRA